MYASLLSAKRSQVGDWVQFWRIIFGRSWNAIVSLMFSCIFAKFETSRILVFDIISSWTYLLCLGLASTQPTFCFREAARIIQCRWGFQLVGSWTRGCLGVFMLFLVSSESESCGLVGFFGHVPTGPTSVAGLISRL